MIRNIVLASKALKTHTHTHCNNINSEINTELEKTNYNRFYLDPMTTQPFSTVKKSAHRKNAPWTNWMGRTQQHLDKKPNEDHLPHSIYTKVCTSLKTDFHCQQQKPKTAFFSNSPILSHVLQLQYCYLCTTLSTIYRISASRAHVRMGESTRLSNDSSRKIEFNT